VANNGQKMDEKVTFEVLSVNHPEGGIIQTQSQNRQKNNFSKVPLDPT